MEPVLPGLGAVTLFVEELAASTSFYRDVLGQAVVYQDENSTVFNLGNTLINLLQVAAARDLIDPAPVMSPDSGARGCS